MKQLDVQYISPQAFYFFSPSINQLHVLRISLQVFMYCAYPCKPSFLLFF